MARVTYSDSVTRFNGSIGGVTFQQNISGSIVKLKSKQVVNPSTLQAYANLNFSAYVNHWSKLTLAERQTWDLLKRHQNFDPWGTGRWLSGYQWFLSCNLNHSMCGFSTIIREAPEYLIPEPSPSFDVVANVNTFYIVFNFAFNLNGNHLFLYCTPPIRSTTADTRKNIITVYSYTGNNIQDLDISSLLPDYFNLELAPFLSSASASMVFSCCVVDPITGFRSSFARQIYQNQPPV